VFETPAVALVVLPVDFAVPVVALVVLLADLAARMAYLSPFLGLPTPGRDTFACHVVNEQHVVQERLLQLAVSIVPGTLGAS
jgi:hypothetical protein